MSVKIKMKGDPSGAGVPYKEWMASNKAKTASKTIAPIVDKISISLTIPWHDKDEVQKAVLEAIKNKGTFKHAKPSDHFHIVQLIAPKGWTEKVHFMFGPKKSFLPLDVRLEFNPSKLGPAGMESLHKVLGTMFPGGWGYFEEYGRVSKIEVAVDLPGMRMHSFHLLPNNILQWKTYKNEGKIKTIYNGKGEQLKAYSKSYHLWAKVHQKKVPKGPPVVRIEKRLKNLGIALKNLASLDNPLTTFKLVSQPSGPPPGEKQKWVWDLFLDSVAQRALGGALKKLPDAKRSTYRKHFAAHAVPWWDPEAIWAHWPKALKESKLLQTNGAGA